MLTATRRVTPRDKRSYSAACQQQDAQSQSREQSPMTYAVGWVANGIAYLIADTLTTGGNPGEPTGSFLEPTTNDRGEYISESLLKIFPISRNVAVAYAGDVELGQRIIGFIYENLTMFSSAPALFQALGRSMGPFSREVNVELIMAGCMPDGEAFVLSWSTDDCRLRRPRDPVQIGTASDVERLVTSDLINATARATSDRQLCLAIVVTQMQAYCVHDNLSARGIGGAFVGLSIGKNDTAWMSDVTYAFVYPNGIDGMVFVRVRDGFVVTYSTKRGDMIVALGNRYATPDFAGWKATWGSTLSALVQDPESEFMSFLDLKKRMNALVRRSPRGSWQGHVNFERSGGSKKISTGPEVSAALAEEVERPDSRETFQMFLALAGD